MDPLRIEFSSAWLAAGAVGGIGALAALRRYGWPILVGGSVLGLATLGHMIYGEPARPVLERVDLRLPNLPAALDGMRIGQISDAHLGLLHTSNNLRWAVEQMERERPELIVLTGDHVMLKHAIPQLTPLLRGLRAPLGVYAIAGNHDHWEGLRDVRSALQLAGIPMLINQHCCLTWNGADLWLIGVDDVWDGELDYAAALAGVPEDSFKILLGHAPDIADDAAQYGFDLQLAGHVHGGHIRVPVLGAFARPRYGRRYLDGFYQVGTMAMYVSRGLGGAPLRLFCPPEATILTLRRA
jgi:predicted MPP superfamily phosphohydrolase